MKEDAKQKRSPQLFDKKSDCCGCGACYSICPQHAITMREDEEGFVYPTIDSQKCVSCMLCEGICIFKKSVFENS